MIPSQNIVAWAAVAPWAEPRQVEQDLIISQALIEMFGDRVIDIFGRYMESSGALTSRAQAQERMFAKLAHPRLWQDVRPLLPADRATAHSPTVQAQLFRRVFEDLVDRLPGKPWERIAATKTRFGIEW